MRGSSVTSQGEVCGHFVEQSPQSWQPLPQESTAFFRAVVSNEDDGVAALLDENPELLNAQLTILYWGADPKTAVADVETAVKTSVSVRHRTPLMLAAQCSSMDVMLLLLDRGADVHAKALEDGHTALQVAMNSDTSSPAIIDVLKEAAKSAAGKPAKQPAESASFFGVHQGQEMNGGDVSNPEGFPYSTAELRLPEYTDDEFRMFSFKIARCNKKYTHDWRSCPFAHPTENARRRDPREFRYCSIACPDYKQGFCIRGDGCEFAHGVFEGWLHPARYRTQLCKDGANCHRPVCFFAHCLPELRTPTCTWTPDSDTLNAAGVVAPRSFAPPPEPQPNAEAIVNSSIKSNLSASPSSAIGYEELEMSGFLEIADEARPRHPPDSPINLPGNSSYGGASSDASVASGYAAHHMPPMPPMQPSGQSQDSRHAPRPRPNPPPTAAPKREMLSGFTTPRMSNSFARRHGLNPKDNAMLNLQKLALQTQVARPPPPPQPRYAEEMQPMQPPWVYGKQGYRAMGQMGSGRQPPQWQNAGPPARPAMPHSLPVHMYGGMQHVQFGSGLPHGMMPGMHAGGPVDASSVTALNHSLLALGLQHNQHPLAGNAMNLGAFNSGMPLSEAYPSYHGGGTQA